MSLQNATIVFAPTSIDATGGTSQNWSLKKVNGNQLTIGCDSDSDSRLRKQAVCKTSTARPLASGANGFSQNRSQIDVTIPHLLSNGTYASNAVGAYQRFDPETTDAQRKEERYLLAMMLVDPDLQSFWDSQSNA